MGPVRFRIARPSAPLGLSLGAPRPLAAERLAPVWDGSSLADKTILVYGEQGIGDEIMFASCLPELIEQADRCLVACEPRLVPLFRRSFPTATVVSIDDIRSGKNVPHLDDLDVQILSILKMREVRQVDP